MDELAREYYRAIDTHDYDALGDILAPEFTHDRPDRTIAGRETFVQFMREERPETDTTHEIKELFRNDNGIAIRGTLSHANGDEWFEFVDVFTVDGAMLVSLKTYSRSSDEGDTHQ